MRKSNLNKIQSDILDNNMVHLTYEVSGLDDIIHPFSAEGYEIVSDDFESFLERYRPAIPKKTPIFLEVTGSDFTEKEKELIGNTIWGNYCFNMTEADITLRQCVKKSLMYILCGLLSGILIFWLGENANEVISTFAYIPFWFFIERFFMFMAFDSVPVWRDKVWNMQVASMKIIFPEDGVASLKDYDYDEIKKEIRENAGRLEKENRENRQYVDNSNNQGLISYSCHPGSLADMVQMPLRDGREIITYEMKSYIDWLEPFVKKDTDLELIIDCRNISEENHHSITSAIRNYYSYIIALEEKLIRYSNSRIKIFFLLFVVSAIVLMVFGAVTDAVTHELLIITFWMFADSTMEFLLVDNINARRRICVLERFMNMRIKYKAS